MENTKITFEELVEACRQDTYRLILTLSYRNVDIANDVFQNTMERAYLGFKKTRNQQNLKGWIYTIARNEFKTFIRKESKKNGREKNIDDYIYDQKEESFFEADFSIEHIDNSVLNEAINKLDYNMQRDLELIYYYGMTIKEIADASGENYNTVKSRHIRACRKLHDILIKEGFCDE